MYIRSQTTPAAMRMREYKIHFIATQEQATHLGIDYGVTQKTGLSPWLFNLYIDPKETMPLGHRMSPWLASMVAEVKAQAAMLKKYPPKDIGLGVDN